MPIIEKIYQLLPFRDKAGLRKILANVSWLFADKILRMGFGLIVGVWIARYLGVEQFGMFNFAAAFVVLFSPIATLGLDAIVIRKLLDPAIDKDKLLGTTFWLKLLGGFTSVFLVTVCILLIRKSDLASVWLVTILALVGVVQAFDTIDFWFQSQVQSKYTVIAKNSAFIAISLLKVYLITVKAPLIAFAWAGLTEICLSAVGLVVAYRLKGFSIWKWQWSLPVASSLIKDSLPLIFSSFAIIIYVKIDQIMLGWEIGDTAVGIYSSATRISEIWYFIPLTIVASVSPSIYKAKQLSQSLYYQKIGKLNRIVVFMSIAVALPMTFLSKTVVVLLFGNNYIDAGDILAIHIWASVFVSMGVAASPWFIAENLTQIQMYKSISGALMNIFLNIFLIPAYGGIGAAIATVISYASSDLLSNLIHPKTRQLCILQLRSLFTPFQEL